MELLDDALESSGGTALGESAREYEKEQRDDVRDIQERPPVDRSAITGRISAESDRLSRGNSTARSRPIKVESPLFALGRYFHPARWIIDHRDGV